MTPQTARLAVLLVALLLIGAGVWLINRPAALVTLGGLIYVDLVLWSLRS